MAGLTNEHQFNYENCQPRSEIASMNAKTDIKQHQFHKFLIHHFFQDQVITCCCINLHAELFILPPLIVPLETVPTGTKSSDRADVAHGNISPLFPSIFWLFLPHHHHLTISASDGPPLSSPWHHLYLWCSTLIVTMQSLPFLRAPIRLKQSVRKDYLWWWGEKNGCGTLQLYWHKITRKHCIMTQDKFRIIHLN